MITEVVPVNRTWQEIGMVFEVQDVRDVKHPWILGTFTEQQLARKFQQTMARKWETKVALEEGDNGRGIQTQLIERYPNLIAHIICCSLGYATPKCAANILWNAIQDKPEYCEWVDACYRNDARKPVLESIRWRKNHKGYMADFQYARVIVQREIENKQPPNFGLASWF